jgi:hypothetical protein
LCSCHFIRCGGTIFTKSRRTIYYEEKEALEQEFAQQPPLLQLHIPPDNLGKIPPPKGDPSFELKPLPDDLKYAYLVEKNIYPVIISANLSVFFDKGDGPSLCINRCIRPSLLKHYLYTSLTNHGSQRVEMCISHLKIQLFISAQIINK